eukprot:scaffold269_cov404-Prasinococcus_capsulatus_cf.AAC.4
MSSACACALELPNQPPGTGQHRTTWQLGLHASLRLRSPHIALSKRGYQGQGINASLVCCGGSRQLSRVYMPPALWRQQRSQGVCCEQPRCLLCSRAIDVYGQQQEKSTSPARIRPARRSDRSTSPSTGGSKKKSRGGRYRWLLVGRTEFSICWVAHDLSLKGPLRTPFQADIVGSRTFWGIPPPGRVYGCA